MEQEKRHGRRFVTEDMDIGGRMMFATEVKIVNISIKGVSVKADRRLDIGCQYMLKLIDKGKVIPVKASVVWSSISGKKEGLRGDVVPIYTAGMRFVNLLDEKVSAIRNLIGDHADGYDQRLSGLRVAIKAPEKVVLNVPSRYTVKKLSLSGMLIQSSLALEIDQRFPMELFLTDDKPMRFTGRIASCSIKDEKGHKGYGVGIAFEDMIEKDADRLREFINLLY